MSKQINNTPQLTSRLKYLKPKLVVVYKDKRSEKESLVDVNTHFQATERVPIHTLLLVPPTVVKNKKNKKKKGFIS